MEIAFLVIAIVIMLMIVYIIMMIDCAVKNQVYSLQLQQQILNKLIDE